MDNKGMYTNQHTSIAKARGKDNDKNHVSLLDRPLECSLYRGCDMDVPS